MCIRDRFSICSTQYAHLNNGSAYALHNMHIWTTVQHMLYTIIMHTWTTVQHMLYTTCTFEQRFSICSTRYAHLNNGSVYALHNKLCTFEQQFSICSTQYAHLNNSSAYALHDMHILTTVSAYALHNNYAHLNTGSAYALHNMHIWTTVQHMLHTHGTNWSKRGKDNYNVIENKKDR